MPKFALTNFKVRVNAVFTPKNSVGFVGDKRGFTLIELVIASGIFIFGIMGAFSLALANLNTSRENINRVLAANLSREGLELIRNIRDSNWLRIDSNADSGGASGIQPYSWDYYLKNPSNPNDMFAIVDYNDANPSVICSGTTDINNCMNICSANDSSANDSCRLYINGGFYERGGSGSATNLYRLIQIQGICMDSGLESVVDSSVCAVGEKIGIRVTSRVSWFKGSELKHLDAVEDMYNWRR